jgi:hypothetical protein
LLGKIVIQRRSQIGHEERERGQLRLLIAHGKQKIFTACSRPAMFPCINISGPLSALSDSFFGFFFISLLLYKTFRQLEPTVS